MHLVSAFMVVLLGAGRRAFDLEATKREGAGREQTVCGGYAATG